MSVETLFLLFVGLAAAQTVTPSCPPGNSPTEVDSPCTNGCRYVCGTDGLCKMTVTTNSMGTTTRSVECGQDAFRPFCPTSLPTVSTTQFCTAGCTYFCRGGGQNSRCTMTVSINGWTTNCSPLPLLSGATDCSSSSACAAQVSQCALFTRRCTCFPDGSIESAGCFRVDTTPQAPTPSGLSPTPSGLSPTPAGAQPTPPPFNPPSPPAPSGTVNCPNDPTCKSFWPQCSAAGLECVCRNGVLVQSNCNDAAPPPTPQPPFNANNPTPFPTPFDNNAVPTPQPVNGAPPTPVTPAPPVVVGISCMVAVLCDSYTATIPSGSKCSIATGASCQCNANGAVIQKRCPVVETSPCNLAVAMTKTQCEAMRAADGKICTVAQGAICLCNPNGGIVSKTCEPKSPIAPGGGGGGGSTKEESCSPALLEECQGILSCGSRKQVCECSATEVTKAECGAAAVSATMALVLAVLLAFV